MHSKSPRRRLPNRRPSEFFDFKSLSLRFTGSVSRYDDGRIGELFLDNHKAGSQIGTLVRDAAIVLSLPCSTAQTSTQFAARSAATVKARPAGRSVPRST